MVGNCLLLGRSAGLAIDEHRLETEVFDDPALTSEFGLWALNSMKGLLDLATDCLPFFLLQISQDGVRLQLLVLLSRMLTGAETDRC